MTEAQQRRENAKAARRAWKAAIATENAELMRKRAEREKRQAEKEGGRGVENSAGVSTSIGPHPQVQVNQLDNKLPTSGSPSGFANSVLPWETGAIVEGRALNPRAVLVRVEGKVVGARKNPVQAFSRHLVVAVVRERNEWVVVGRYNRFGQRVFDEHERRKFMEWQWAGGSQQKREGGAVDGGQDQAVAVGEPGQRESGLRGEGADPVGGAVGVGEGAAGDGREGAGQVPVETPLGSPGACAGHGVGADAGGEVKTL